MSWVNFFLEFSTCRSQSGVTASFFTAVLVPILPWMGTTSQLPQVLRRGESGVKGRRWSQEKWHWITIFFFTLHVNFCPIDVGFFIWFIIGGYCRLLRVLSPKAAGCCEWKSNSRSSVKTQTDSECCFMILQLHSYPWGFRRFWAAICFFFPGHCNSVSGCNAPVHQQSPKQRKKGNKDVSFLCNWKISIWWWLMDSW